MEGREETFGTPVFEAEKRPEPDLMDASFTDAIRCVEAVEEVGLPPFGVVEVIRLAVVGFLIDQDRVEPVPAKLGVFRGLQPMDKDAKCGRSRSRAETKNGSATFVDSPVSKSKWSKPSFLRAPASTRISPGLSVRRATLLPAEKPQ